MFIRTVLALGAALVLVLTSAFGAQSEGTAPERGDRCLVCGKELVDGDHVLLHRGRRVPLCAGACSAAFEADPSPWFAQLQPRGLFAESATTKAAASGWFWLGVWVLTALLSAAAAAWLAVSRAQPPLFWFFVGLLGNFAGLLVLFFVIPRGDATLLPAGVPPGLLKVPTTRSPAVCPSCGHGNHPSARRCGRCSAELSPAAPSEVATSKGGGA